MKLRDFRFPVVDLSLLLAILFLAWAAFCLAKLEPQIARDRQQSRELPDLFRECKELFSESIEKPERARREIDLVWQDGLKAEYLGIAERLEADLPDLKSPLVDGPAAKAGAELQRRMQELKNWIEKQK